MVMRAVQITIDCADPQSLAAWWAETLDGSVVADLGDDMAVDVPSSGLPGLLFQRVPEGKAAKNRVHVDVEVDEPRADDPEIVATTVATLVARGASVVGRREQYGIAWTTLADPVGNEFCVRG